jgi:3-oxoacyl-[acyl-carrier protein] reductase
MTQPSASSAHPQSDWKPLSGKAGIVTGAGIGIGSAIARHLAALGADVGVNYYMSKGGAEKTCDEIKQIGTRALLLPCDVSKVGQVKAMVATAEKELGRIDFLVNNAGGSGHANSDFSVEESIIEDWNLIIGANLTGAFLCSRFVSPVMLAAKSGRIVNISSIAGFTGDCGPAYSAAKAGMLGLTRSCAATLAPYVQVNAILPGFVSSTAHDESLVAKMTPGRKIGTPEEVAELTGDLITAKGTFLTGSCIVMDGGLTSGVIGLGMEWISQRE